jgi:hypothetical protein
LVLKALVYKDGVNGFGGGGETEEKKKEKKGNLNGPVR